MHRLLPLVLLMAAVSFSGCANRSIDEAYGVPDALDWSYFRAAPAEVAQATRLVLERGGVTVESVRNEGAAYVLTVSTSPPSADFTEIRIEPATLEEYRARAQTVPPQRRLADALEVAISAEL